MRDWVQALSCVLASSESDAKRVPGLGLRVWDEGLGCIWPSFEFYASGSCRFYSLKQ